MDKAAKELIQKLASFGPRDPTGDQEWIARKRREEGIDNAIALSKKVKKGLGSMLSSGEKKESSMKSIIDDIIKGAEQNTFGRPVSIQQGFDPTPLDLAKFAGALTALDEQGYSVKEASEYLGLTEAQIRHIVASVR